MNQTQNDNFVHIFGSCPLQAAGTAPGTTVTSVGKTRRPSVSCAPTPSARPTRRGRCAPGPPRGSCAAPSTTSWRGPTLRPRISAQRQTRPTPLQPSPSAARKAPGKPRRRRTRRKAPRGKQPRPEAPTLKLKTKHTQKPSHQSTTTRFHHRRNRGTVHLRHQGAPPISRARH